MLAQRKYRIFLIVSNVVQAVLLILVFLYWPTDPYRGYTKIGELDTGINYCKVVVYVADDWEYAQPAYYEITISGRVEIPFAYFTNVDPERVSIQEFEIIKHPKKNIIGLVTKENPNILLMIHNFDTNENWPRANFTEEYSSVVKRGKSLRNSLNPTLQL
ncbi:hypothetical protein [Leptospira alstonii]|uniref:Uncharacterized protein n=2 Tax=Leptospira alstonii TaxID=28452 RepID=M6CKW8_9LEPT|nr:hypothetical protein [Leptospira alstonii]EMJ92562.1 hypothetical protein LEP1GSC194_0690 [Leptospira alstonii serovar Sichuan str. 79601]EQA79497.1 hypothetical protein LEP1GSC193_0490 [Leptospira alstonii serovar Pingchang str. 80-412]